MAPGPGSWTIDRVHMPNGSSAFASELAPPAIKRGFGHGAKRYGALFSHREGRTINRFRYTQMVKAPDEELPERFANAERVWTTKQWREEVERFHDEVKPDSRARNRALAAVDVAALSDAELADHLDRCRDHLDLMIERHHHFNMTVNVPVGDFLAQVLPWGVATQSELLGLLQGSSRASTGACEELDELVAALRDDPEARAALDSGDAAKALDSLRARGGRVGAATEEFVAFVGLRPADGFDLLKPLAIEHPDLLLRRVVDALDAPPDTADDVAARVEAATERVRARVPEDKRELFDDLLAEARLVYHVRDERGLYQDVWAWGIVRRAMVEVGRRLAAAGLVLHPADALEASYSEARALLRRLNSGGEGGPTAEELIERARRRAAFDPADAPDFLGDPPAPPTVPDGAPEAVRRLMAATGMAIAGMFTGAEPAADAAESGVARGLGVNDGVYEGTARVLATAADLHRIEDGDVLIAPSTTEAFNLALPMLGAIVTDHGGLLSHAAIVAREFGLPALVGCRDATRVIPDGARVRVDAAAGEVRVLS